MRPYELIMKKRNGQELSETEISYLINNYIDKKLPDYQMAALLMAIYFNGMSNEETLALTAAMINSGQILDLSPMGAFAIDKHSTGGVGDTTSLILGPLVAAAGCLIPKMSGRGLGHTGGTIDKLESFPGFDVSLDIEKFREVVKDIGLAIISQTANLAPADKLLYALRDATATVDSIPLIASSIMSKKLAAGSPAIVLDVKVGKGAFMESIDEARHLAETMVSIGQGYGRRVSAVLTAMDSPLGFAIGNILEVKEAIAVLNGNGPRDLTELCLQLGAEMLVLSGKISNHQEARSTIEHVLASGQGVRKLVELVRAQGGDERYVYHPELFPRAKFVQKVRSEKSGYVNAIDAMRMGTVAMELGAGRSRKDEGIDLTAGILLKVKKGDWVNVGDVVAELHTNKKDALNKIKDNVTCAFSMNKEASKEQSLVIEVIRGV